MLAQEIIRHKRDGETLSSAELHFMAQGIAKESIGDAQIAAFAMAVYWRGLTLQERITWTEAMTASGTVLDWSDLQLPGPILDKHSSGGVGDKVSLILAPLLAACGAYVPMISGRGLGHTGGTLDKLASIPGYDTTPELSVFRQVVQQVGCAIVGQTATLAPADRRLYAVRDITATVDSIDLITTSILSKKLAAGLQALVMDIKTGSGAFMTNLATARELAQSIVTVANGAGLKTAALITDMNQVLGNNAGNALEAAEVVEFLTAKRRDDRLSDVVLALAAELLVLGNISANVEQARQKLIQLLDDGSAAEYFSRMVAALGGPGDFVERYDTYLIAAPVQKAIYATQQGFVTAVDTRALGLAIVQLGGGRQQVDDIIDYRVGLSDVCQIGDEINHHRPLAFVHAGTESDAVRAIAAVQQAILLQEVAIEPQKTIHALVT